MYFREILTHDIYIDISIYLSGIMRDMIMMDYPGLIWEFRISTLQPQALKCFHPQQPAWNDFGDASVVYI